MVANFYLFLDYFGLKTGKSFLPQQIISNSEAITYAILNFATFLEFEWTIQKSGQMTI